jgi:ubiquinone/menaquinone biosynthesis C-methylase UbiE
LAFYRDHVFPALIDLSMRNARLTPHRRRIAGAAEGRVLEIGIGSGLNLPHYAAHVREIFGLDPSPALLARASRRTPGAPIRLLAGSAECIPLASGSVDTVVTTFTACSIPDVAAALAEMRRVLRPGGRLLFAEHGRAPSERVAWWQDRLTPAWRSLSGGCHLNRKIDDLVADAGFRIDRLERGYIQGPKIISFFYEGAAAPR